MTIKGKLQDWAKRLAGARTALGELHGLDHALRAEHAAAVTERQNILGASPPLSELLITMEEQVDAAAAYWMREHGVHLPHTLGPGLEIKSDGSVVPQRPRFPFALEMRPLDFNALCALAPDLVKQQLCRILSAIPYKAGPPLADRTRLLAETDGRLAEIERTHEGLVDEAAALEPPVTLTLLPEVKARRDAAAAKAQRERVQREARERAAAAVDATIPTRAVPSPYLTREKAQPEFDALAVQPPKDWRV